MSQKPQPLTLPHQALRSMEPCCLIALAVLITFIITPTTFAASVAATPASNALRDPTRPPSSVDAPVSPTGAPSASFRPSQILVVNGTRYLLVNGQKLRVGDAVDNKLIERIDDAAIWLREGALTQKIPLFEGVEKIIPTAAPNSNAAAKSAAAASHAKTNTKQCNDAGAADCSKPKKAAPPSATPVNKAGKTAKTQGEK